MGHIRITPLTGQGRTKVGTPVSSILLGRIEWASNAWTEAKAAVSDAIGIAQDAQTSAADAQTAAAQSAAAAQNAENAKFATVDSGTAALISNATAGPNTRSALFRVEPRDINLHLAGAVSPANSAATNLQSIQAEIDAAPDGARLLLPYTPGATHHISGSIVLRPGMILAGLGGQASITQSAWGKPIIDAGRGGVSVSDISGAATSAKAVVPGTYRDGSATNAATVVWVGGSGATTRLTRITGTGLTSVVRATPWDSTTNTAHDYTTIIATDIESSGCDWGIVGTGWTDSIVNGARGTYALRSGSADPAHLVYVADTLPNRDIQIVGVDAWNSTGGSVVQAKSVAGLILDRIHARNCTGLLSLRAVQNVHMTNQRSIADASPVDPVIYIQGSGTEAFIQARGIRLDLTTNVQSMRIDGSDGSYDDILVTEARAAQADAYSIAVYGSRNRLHRARVINSGSAAWRAIGLFAGSGHLVRFPSAHNTRVGVTVASGVTGCVVEYDPAEISRHPTSGSRFVQTLDPSTAIRQRSQIQAITMAASSVVQIRSDENDTAAVNVSDTTGFTVATPIEPAPGRVICYRFTNSSGGTMGTVSWVSSGAGHTLNSAWTNPAAGATKAIWFQYDATAGKWLEINRSA